MTACQQIRVISSGSLKPRALRAICPNLDGNDDVTLVDIDGHKDILGMWAGDGESGEFWLAVPTDPKGSV